MVHIVDLHPYLTSNGTGKVLLAIPLLQFVFVLAPVVSYLEFVLSSLFLISPCFGASGRLCFVIVAFPRYLHLYFLCYFVLLKSIDSKKNSNEY